MFDLIIRGGTVFDGTGRNGYKADLGIRDGVIAAIGDLQAAQSRAVIDAAGLAVTPGFIDMHSHADCSLPMWPDAESLLGQGVTTVFAGHCGMSLAPVTEYWLEQYFEGEALDQVIPQFPGGPIPGVGRVVKTDDLAAPFLKAYGTPLDWRSFGDYLRHLEQNGIGVNIAANVGHSQLRQQVLGYDARRAATPEEIARMCGMLDAALTEGAYGLSFGFDYDTSMYAEQDELLALAQTAARHGAVVSAHMQTGPERCGRVNEGFTILDGFKEFLDLGLAAGAHVHISHIYCLLDGGEIPGMDEKTAVETVLALIEDYRKKGVCVTWDYLGRQPAACFYFVQLAQRFSPYVEQCGGKQAFAEALKNGWYRKTVRDEIAAGKHRAVTPFAALSRSAGTNWGKNLLILRSTEPAWQGKTVGEIAVLLDMTPLDTALHIMQTDPEAYCDRVRETDPAFGHYYVQDPDMSFGTDNGTHHYGFRSPAAGDLPYVMGTPTEFSGMVEYFHTFRELPFEQLIRRMSGNAAVQLGLRDRGFIKEGMRADVLVIDRDNLRSNLDPASPQNAPDGIDWVIVNGRIAVDHKKHLNPRSGMVLRRENP